MGELDPKFSRNAPASTGHILAIEAEVGRSLPASYKDFLTITNGGEGFVGSDGYLAIWPVEYLQERRMEYEFDKYLPNILPIGSNGGGEALAIRFHGNAASFGYIPFGDLTEGSFIEIGYDFWDVLAKIGTGKAFDCS